MKGCIDVLDQSNLAAVEVSGLDSQEVSYDFEREVQAGAEGEVFTWYFDVANAYDIDFSVELLPISGQKEANESKRVLIQKVARLTTGKGSFKAPYANAKVKSHTHSHIYIHECDFLPFGKMYCNASSSRSAVLGCCRVCGFLSLTVASLRCAVCALFVLFSASVPLGQQLQLLQLEAHQVHRAVHRAHGGVERTHGVGRFGSRGQQAGEGGCGGKG